MRDSVRHITWKHIDGPMVVWQSGHISWLTLRQRFLFWIGAMTIRDLEKVAALPERKKI